MLLIDERQVAAEGLDAMESWMREIGCVMTISELGCDESITSLLVFDSFLYCDLKYSLEPRINSLYKSERKMM